jgi:hypothetical protein
MGPLSKLQQSCTYLHLLQRDRKWMLSIDDQWMISLSMDDIHRNIPVQKIYLQITSHDSIC